jgi:GNAT superfamily N-acetyltransferase
VSGAFRIEALASRHDRAGFVSGAPALDEYFRRQATQDVRRHVAACYVAIEAKADRIAGYYTLSASGVPVDAVPERLAKKLPRYPLVPVARLGRLAVDQAYRGRKLGAALLWDVAMRAARSEVAVFALVVDAKDDCAADFYRRFEPFGATPRCLILSLANFAAL